MPDTFETIGHTVSSNDDDEYDDECDALSDTPTVVLDLQEDTKPNIAQIQVKQEDSDTSRIKPVKSAELYRCDCGDVTKGVGHFKSHFKKHSKHQFTCAHCSIIIERTSSYETFVDDIATHLTKHSSDHYGCRKCQAIRTSDNKIILHSLKEHADTEAAYDHWKWGNSHWTKKSLRCKLVCSFCQKECGTAKKMDRHFQRRHKDSIVVAKVVKGLAFHSDDANEVLNEKSEQIFYRRKYVCEHKACLEKFDSRKFLIEHFYRKHPLKPLEFKLTPPKFILRPFNCFRFEVKKHDQKIVYTCPFDGCARRFFDSVNMTYSHWKKYHQTTEKSFRFSTKKLLMCSHCHHIGTTDLIEEHAVPYRLPLTTKDAFDETKCGGCNYQIQIDPKGRTDFCLHYHNEHPGDAVNAPTDDLLEELRGPQTNVDYYAVDCCSGHKVFFEKRGGAQRIFQHMNVCKKFIEMVKKRKNDDTENVQSMTDLCTFDEFLAFSGDIRVTFRSAFTMKLKYFAKTLIGRSLKKTFAEKIKQVYSLVPAYRKPEISIIDKAIAAVETDEEKEELRKQRKRNQHEICLAGFEVNTLDLYDRGVKLHDCILQIANVLHVKLQKDDFLAEIQNCGRLLIVRFQEQSIKTEFLDAMKKKSILRRSEVFKDGEYEKIIAINENFTPEIAKLVKIVKDARRAKKIAYFSTTDGVIRVWKSDKSAPPTYIASQRKWDEFINEPTASTSNQSQRDNHSTKRKSMERHDECAKKQKTHLV